MASGEISKLYVSIGTNLSGLTAGLSKAFGEIKKFGVDVAKHALGNIVSAGMSKAFSAITNGFSNSIENASSLNETLSKTDVLLGDTADSAKKFAKEMEMRGLGSQQKVLESYLGTVNQLTNQGVDKKRAQELAEASERRVADVASQDNADPDQVRRDLAAAQAGEFQVLRKYGVDLSAEEQQASGKSRSEYVIDKFMARTQRAQGDFERTKYGYANLGRAADTKTTAVSARIGQDLLIVGQAFQYFRGRFMDTIMQLANGGAFKQLGEHLYTAFSYIGIAAEALIQPMVTALTSAASSVAGFAASIVPYLVNASDTWQILTNKISIVFLSIWETLTSVANKLTLGLVEKQDMGGAKQILRDENAQAQARIDASKAAMDAQVNDLKAKFTADTGSKTGPGALGAMQQPVSTAMKASSHAFSSLLSGVFGQKPDKQLAVLERIAQNTSPKDTGVQSVTSKTTLASDRGGFKTAFGV